MCIAIVNKNSILEYSVFQNSFDNNPDGAGIAYINDGRINVIKEMKDVSVLYSKYVSLRQSNDLPMLIHFRIGTSGIKDERNVHPFLISDELALIHNGMIQYNVVNKDYSDTWHFTELIKSLKTPKNILNNSSMEFQMFSAFTSGSKVAFLSAEGQFSILNESAGHWKGDTWYSNKTYKECEYYNVGGQIVWKNGKEYSALNRYDSFDYPTSIGFTYSDLKEWKDRILTDDELSWCLPYSVSEFNSLDYSNKVMVCLSLGHFMYDLNVNSTSGKALNELMAVYKVRDTSDLFKVLYDDYSELITDEA